MKKEAFEAIATLMGTVIGAGILGIPYVVSRSGILIGTINIIFIGLMMMIVNLFMGEIVLRTKGNHQLTGYAEKYLGSKGKYLMTVSMIIGVYGALLAYLIGEGRAISAIFGGNPIIYSLGFLMVVSFIIYRGIKTVEKSELFFMFASLTVVIIITAVNIVNMDKANLMIGDGNLLLPFGVVLFAFLGTAAIPEMREELKNNWKSLKKCIIIGSLIPLAVYLCFGLSVVAVTGLSTTELATVGLGEYLGKYMVVFGNLFAMITMTTAFIALGLALKEMYNYDYKIRAKKSFLLVILIPLIIFLLGYKDFIEILSISGSFSGGITGILIVFMLWKAKGRSERKPEFEIKFSKILGILVILMFLLGMLYELARII